MLRDLSHLSDPPADTEWVGFCMPKSHDLFSIKGWAYPWYAVVQRMPIYNVF